MHPEEGEWNGAEVKHNRDTSGEGEGAGGRTKWEPAAPAAHHVFKSLYDLKTKAKTNNRTFSIIYSSDVGSVLFDELPEFCARRASFVCLLTSLCTSITVFFCVAFSHPLIPVRGRRIKSQEQQRNLLLFVLSRLVQYYLLFVTQFFVDKKWNMYKLVHCISFFTLFLTCQLWHYKY